LEIPFKYYLKTSWEGLLNSYAQVFFSLNKVFAAILLLVSFFDLGAGLSGVLAIIIGQFTAYLFNFNHEQIRDGSYTYNSLTVGLAIGMFYDFNLSLLIVLFISSLLTFFLTLWFSARLSKNGLPFLSIPFLVMTWIIILGVDNFTAINLKQKLFLSLEGVEPKLFTGVTDFIATLPFANTLYLYFRSLGAILFQFNDLAGILIAVGLLIYSRMAFVLSIFGFLIGYLFYEYMAGDFSQLIYSYIGFNFILTAIALGGFFVVPSRRSYALLIITIPIIAVLISALHSLLYEKFGLPLYSLPFNIVVLLFLSAMALRNKASGLDLVVVQQFSPERNHYKHFNRLSRFKSDTYFHFGLPIMGEWNISQGHEGKITHKEDWKYAWDFDIRDEQKSTFRQPGYELEDYYCYNLPVIAPAAGYVYQIIDGIADNKIGKVDLEQNWGNTIIIKHGEYMYTKLSHLKKDTFKVKQGDYVKKGDVIAYCGSSGRSPEPHLHFQIQTNPYVGGKTLLHPISYYLTKKENQFTLHTFDIPKEGDLVCNVRNSKLLTDSFDFIPGKLMEFETEKGELIKWEVFVNALNQAYIYCYKTQATAYFVNDGTMFYFTDFYGEKKSLLHQFYLGAHRVILGYYKDIEVKDRINIEDVFGNFVKGIHDFTAPFFHYQKAHYASKFIEVDDEHNPEKLVIQSQTWGEMFGNEKQKTTYEFVLEGKGIDNIKITSDNITKTVKCIS
jgi:urea transporter